MYIKSTIYPYHSIEKSKVHQNQPFPITNLLLYSYRGEKEKGKERGEKRRKIDTVLYFTFYKPTQNLDNFKM